MSKAQQNSTSDTTIRKKKTYINMILKVPDIEKEASRYTDKGPCYYIIILLL